LDPLLSVVIPSYNTAERILPCLDALRRQQTELDFEIIVADSSDGGAPGILERLADIVLVRSPVRLFPGTARNLGAQAAAGRVICFTDADCVPAPDWIENIWKARPDQNRTLVGGAITNGTPQSAVGSAEYFSELSGFLPLHLARAVEFLPSANLAVGAAEFAEVGGFRDFEKGSDVTFGRDCRAAGIRPLFDPSVRVAHLNRTDLGGFLANQERLGWGAGNNRALFDLPYSWLARHPVAWPLVPAARLARMCLRVARYGRGERWSFLKSLPAVAAGALYYGAGFARGAREGLASKQGGRE
jgi:glycosyltransferase involved in cell wall biosynthesis